MQEKIKSITTAMKEIFKIIKENLILLLGIGLFTHSLFNFDNNRYCSGETIGGGIEIPGLELPGYLGRFECNDPAIYYYYDKQTLILLTVGAILITIGLLKLYERKNKK